MPAQHERLDLDRWIAEFPLLGERRAARDFVEQADRQWPGRYASKEAIEDHIQMLEPDGDIVVGPRQIALIEQLRIETGLSPNGIAAVPVDVLVWGQGEPPNRAGTRIGGLPYRPRSEPWPVGHGGSPSIFVGQVCFHDSTDLLAELRLPGDVLCIFSPHPSGIWSSDDEDPEFGLQYEWWPLGISDLVSDAPAAPTTFPVDPCFAQLHRTFDYPEVPEDHPIRRFDGFDQLCVVEGGKIGGVPRFAQEEPPRPGRFVAALGSINPFGERFPLLNVPRNPSGSTNLRGDWLMFGDCGSLYLHVDECSETTIPRLHWSMQGY